MQQSIIKNTIMKKLIRLLILTLMISQAQAAGRPHLLTSPDGRLKVTVEIGQNLTWSVQHENTPVISASPLSVTLTNGTQWGVNPRLIKKKATEHRGEVTTRLYKKSTIPDEYNELILQFRGDYSLVFRAYNQGVAYRFTTSGKEEAFVKHEEVKLKFNADHPTLVPYVGNFNPGNPERQFFNSFENTYTYARLSELHRQRLIFLPLLVELNDGKKLVFTEADLESYPGLYMINRTGETALTGEFAPYPKTTVQGGHNMLQQIVTERENYVARIKATASLPWRVLAIASCDRELADNDLVYLLASPSRIADTSWIKPGKVAWDWWNDWNIYGVDFRAGVNNETYKYYIDFASENNIEYVILDEGWAVNRKADLMQIVPEIDVKALVDYGRSKNVGIILWAGYWAMDRDMENVCKTYAEMGVKGFKVDFMDRDDQAMVDFYYRCAETAAKYRLIIDFHGAYKPTGLHRTWPNVLNFEGVHGLEQLKWSPPEVDMVRYDVTFPYIRMLAGPVDYTQGAMRNANRYNYRPINSEPMSQGTRCHQLAEYIIFESPFNMLCDNPSNYRNEMECTRFIAEIPTVWDKSVALDGVVGEYIVMARQKEGVWYVGGLTNWNNREVTVNLDFLGDGYSRIELFRDGINADRVARDYKKEIIPVPDNKTLKLTLMQGGGFAAKITR